MKKKVVLLVGRDNWTKDLWLNKLLVEHLQANKVRVVWEDPAAGVIHGLRRLESRFPWLPESAKKLNLRLVQLLYAMTHWRYFGYLYQRREHRNFVESRCKALRTTIRRLGCVGELYILSRSSGGRVSSLIADDFDIRGLICLSYPFKHPNLCDEPNRYSHLGTLKTPFLIIQGDKDEYGGLEVTGKYAFSPSVELRFVQGNHDFKLNDEDWQRVVQMICDAIDIPGPRGQPDADGVACV